MRTTAEENDRMGRWTGEKFNQMDAPAQFFLSEGGVSLLGASSMAFHDPVAANALFAAPEETVRQTATRRFIRVPQNINDPQCTATIVDAFHSINGGRTSRRKVGR